MTKKNSKKNKPDYWLDRQIAQQMKALGYSPKVIINVLELYNE